MSFKVRITSLWKKFENLFLVNHACLACRREIPDDTRFSICKDCLDNIEKIEGNVCKVCGESILDGNSYCDVCKSNKFDFDQSRSFARYLDVSSAIVKRFKYGSKKYYGKYIAELMFENKEYFDGVDYLTFVPIGDKRRKDRGFNQAEEIAVNLGKLLNIPVVDLLTKKGNERHQAGLSQKERQANLSGSILLKDCDEVIKDKVVMIIDDVFTTGSTLSECAKVLKSNKANKPSKIYCYTFAKTVYNSTNIGQKQQNNNKTEEIKLN